MKSSDLTILIAPGWNDSGPDHWQSRWASRLSTARRVEQADFANPDCTAWTDQLVQAVEASSLPVVVVAHSLGTTTLLHAAPRLTYGKGPGQLAGAFLEVDRPHKTVDVQHLRSRHFRQTALGQQAQGDHLGDAVAGVYVTEAEQSVVEGVAFDQRHALGIAAHRHILC